MIDLDYPLIEFVRDNFGNFYKRETSKRNYVITDTVLHPGDVLKLQVLTSSSDPSLVYCFKFGIDNNELCQPDDIGMFTITENHIRKSIAVYIRVRSKNDLDLVSNRFVQSAVEFRYTVMPGDE